MAKSFKPQIKVSGEDKWLSNARCFATREEAEANARDHYSRLSLATAHQAVESDDPVNYRYVNGRLEDVAPVAA